MKKYQPWIGLIARLILGGTLIAAGYLKFDELDKSQMAVRAYELLPVSLANFLGITLPFFELAIGLLLVLGAATRITAGLSAILMIAFMDQLALAKTRETGLAHFHSRSRGKLWMKGESSGHVLKVNENFVRVMGYSPEEVRGQHHRMFVDRESAASPDYKAFWDKLKRGEHAARFAGGRLGVLQGCMTNILMDGEGQIEGTHSVSAGLDYAAVGPEHA